MNIIRTLMCTRCEKSFKEDLRQRYHADNVGSIKSEHSQVFLSTTWAIKIYFDLIRNSHAGS